MLGSSSYDAFAIVNNHNIFSDELEYSFWKAAEDMCY